MSTNNTSNVFRTLDVDKYSEDIYKEDQDLSEPAPVVTDTSTNTSEIESLLAAGQASEALTQALNNTALGE